MSLDPRTGRSLARGLGWFSIALGVAEITMPGQVAKWAGIRGREPMLVGFGIREVVNGIGLLTTTQPGPWLWARTAGDLLDLATVAGSPGRMSTRRTAALLSLGAVTAVDAWCAASMTGQSTVPRQWVSYRDRSGFRRPPDELRGAALATFTMPADMRIPEPMRPWAEGKRPASRLSTPATVKPSSAPSNTTVIPASPATASGVAAADVPTAVMPAAGRT